MKKITLLFSLLVVLAAPRTRGQTYIYHPFPDSDAVWNEYLGFCEDYIMGGYIIESQNFLNGDTAINGQIYSKLYQNGIQLFTDCNGTPEGGYFFWPNIRQGAIRQDSSKHIFFFSYDSLSEQLLYDFNLHLGSYLPFSYIHKDSSNKIFVSSVDSIFDGTVYRTRYILSDSTYFDSTWSFWSNYASIIEGIGSTWGLLQSIDNAITISGHSDYRLRCFTRDSIVKYIDSTLYCPYCSPACAQMLSVAEKKNNYVLTLSPNPFHTTATLTVADGRGIASFLAMTIYDVFGRVVRQQIVNSKSEIVNRIGLADGIYFFEVQAGDEVVGRDKFVVQ